MNDPSDSAVALPVSLQVRTSKLTSGNSFAGHRSNRRIGIPCACLAFRSTPSHSERSARYARGDGVATDDLGNTPTRCNTHAGERDRSRRFDELVAVHLDDLYGFAYWLSGDRSVSEDVVQEALIRAWKSIDRLNDHKAAKGWLLTIVRRENARHYGRKQLQQADVPDEKLDTHRTEYDTSTEAFVLRRALDRLPPEYREPLLMQVVYGYSLKEIAEQLGISNAGAGTRLFRAREKMRGLL